MAIQCTRRIHTHEVTLSFGTKNVEMSWELRLPIFHTKLLVKFVRKLAK